MDMSLPCEGEVRHQSEWDNSEKNTEGYLLGIQTRKQGSLRQIRMILPDQVLFWIFWSLVTPHIVVAQIFGE